MASKEGWIKVYETPHLHQACMIQSILENHQIPSVLLNQKDSTYILVGEVQVLVSPEHAAGALDLIAELEP